ncbi:30S ribosomal protein S8 [Bienertia sinuspersici]
MAMRYALKTSIEAGFECFEIETDNMKLYSSLRKKVCEATPFEKIITDILWLANLCTYVSFSFVKRGGNRVAHSLAKLSSSFSEARVWLEDIPAGVNEFVIADLAGLNLY